MSQKKWLWQPFIPLSKTTIIKGVTGAGKTTTILTIAAMLSQGIQPPSQPCSPITTLYLADEDEVADSSLKRFLRAGGVASRFAFCGFISLEEELMGAIEKTGARLIVIDP